MKTKVWVLSTCAPGSDEPCLPEVFTSGASADARFAEWMKEQWEHFGAEDADSGERAPFPSDPLRAHEIMLSLNDMEDKRRFGGWEITSHEIDVPVPQAFRDLVTLAAGLEEFESDYRFTAVLRACEAIVSGAGASSAPAEPDPLRMLQRLAEKTRRANSIQHSGGKLCPDDWAELHQLTNEAFGVLAEVKHG